VGGGNEKRGGLHEWDERRRAKQGTYQSAKTYVSTPKEGERWYVDRGKKIRQPFGRAAPLELIYQTNVKSLFCDFGEKKKRGRSRREKERSGCIALPGGPLVPTSINSKKHGKMLLLLQPTAKGGQSRGGKKKKKENFLRFSTRPTREKTPPTFSHRRPLLIKWNRGGPTNDRFNSRY